MCSDITMATGLGMDVLSVRVDPEMKHRMKELKDIDWAEVIRKTLRERIELEGDLRTSLDGFRALRGARGMDAIRRTLRTTRFDSAREVRTWRDSRK
jgi:hypothetical protein